MGLLAHQSSSVRKGKGFWKKLKLKKEEKGYLGRNEKGCQAVGWSEIFWDCYDFISNFGVVRGVWTTRYGKPRSYSTFFCFYGEGEGLGGVFCRNREEILIERNGGNGIKYIWKFPPGWNIHIKYNVIFYFRAWADTAFVDALLHVFFFFDCIAWGMALTYKMCILKWIHGPSLEAKAIGSFAELETNDNAASYPGFLIKIITSPKGDMRDGKGHYWAPSTRWKSLSVEVGQVSSKHFLNSTISLSFGLFCSFPHTRPRPDGVTGIQLTKGKPSQENP